MAAAAKKSAGQVRGLAGAVQARCRSPALPMQSISGYAAQSRSCAIPHRLGDFDGLNLDSVAVRILLMHGLRQVAQLPCPAAKYTSHRNAFAGIPSPCAVEQCGLQPIHPLVAIFLDRQELCYGLLFHALNLPIGSWAPEGLLHFRRCLVVWLLLL